MRASSRFILAVLGLLGLALAALLFWPRPQAAPASTSPGAGGAGAAGVSQSPGPGPTLHLGLRHTVRPGGSATSLAPGAQFLAEEHYLGAESAARAGPIELSLFAAGDGLRDVRLTDGDQLLFHQPDGALYVTGTIQLLDAARPHHLVLSAQDQSGRRSRRAVTAERYQLTEDEPQPRSRPLVQAATSLLTERRPLSGPGFSGTLHLHAWPPHTSGDQPADLAVLVGGPWQSLRLVFDGRLIYASQPRPEQTPSHALLAFPDVPPGRLQVELRGLDGELVVQALEVGQPGQAHASAPETWADLSSAAAPRAPSRLE
ncbi:MAG: hypothetical protein HY690_19370 [Chloroflexi bacterium]|nr:hypothetical protein [Chloroflexota bacterium]